MKLVQRTLGHKSAVTTLDVYGHLFPDSDDLARRALAAAAPLVSSACHGAAAGT